MPYSTLQHPEKKLGVSPVYKGPQGVGKGLFISTIGKIVSPYFAHLSSYKQLLGAVATTPMFLGPHLSSGNFNSIVANKILIFL